MSLFCFVRCLYLLPMQKVSGQILHDASLIVMEGSCYVACEYMQAVYNVSSFSCVVRTSLCDSALILEPILLAFQTSIYIFKQSLFKTPKDRKHLRHRSVSWVHSRTAQDLSLVPNRINKNENKAIIKTHHWLYINPLCPPTSISICKMQPFCGTDSKNKLLPLNHACCRSKRFCLGSKCIGSVQSNFLSSLFGIFNKGVLFS